MGKIKTRTALFILFLISIKLKNLKFLNVVVGKFTTIILLSCTTEKIFKTSVFVLFKSLFAVHYTMCTVHSVHTLISNKGEQGEIVIVYVLWEPIKIDSEL